MILVPYSFPMRTDFTILDEDFLICILVFNLVYQFLSGHKKYVQEICNINTYAFIKENKKLVHKQR